MERFYSTNPIKLGLYKLYKELENYLDEIKGAIVEVLEVYLIILKDSKY